MSYRQTTKDTFFGLGLGGCAIVVIFALMLALGAFWLFVRPAFMDLQREGTQHSQQYVETKRSLLLSLIADAEGAPNEAQKSAAINRFCEEYTYVDFDVPSSVRSFASANCR